MGDADVADATPPDAMASPAPVRVFLMAGQSNMEGYGPLNDREAGDWEGSISLNALIAAGMEADTILDPRDDVYVDFGGDGHSPPGVLRPGFGATPYFFGPELGMGEVLGEALAEPVVMFKSAAGGTTLGGDWRPPSAGGEVGALYTDMTASFAEFLDTELSATFPAALADGGYEISGFIWLQGWNDQFEDGFVAQYEDALVALITDVRAAVGVENLPAIIVEGPTLQEELRAARLAAIRRLEATYPGRTLYVATEDLVQEEVPGNFHFHFNAHNYLEVGRRTARAILEAGFLDRPEN
jgi:alpha-galactosidase